MIPEDTAEIYMTYFYTWPVIDTWWLGATLDGSAWVGMDGGSVDAWAYWSSGEPSGNGQACAAWNVSAFGWSSEGCGEEHPSICVIP